MPKQHDGLMDAYTILERMSVEELENRVQWLEESLKVHQTLLIVKKLSLKKPLDLHLPWESMIEDDDEADEPSPTNGKPKGYITNSIQSLLERHPGGMSEQSIAETLSIPVASVKTALISKKWLYEKVGHFWSVIKQPSTAPPARLPLDVLTDTT